MSDIQQEAKQWKNVVWKQSIHKNISIRKFAEAYVNHEILYMPVISLTPKQLQRRREAAQDQLAEELGLDVTRAKMSALCYKFRWLFEDAIEKKETKPQTAEPRPPVWAEHVARKLARSRWCGRRSGTSRDVEQLANALAERGWRARTVDPVVASGASPLRQLWASMCDAVKRKLCQLRARGDLPSQTDPAAVITSADWRVADLLLLYGPAEIDMLVDNESICLYDQLNPLIVLFHLVQEYRVEEPADKLTLGRRWSLIFLSYAKRGCIASLVMLQRRWVELKWQARNRVLAYWRQNRTGAKPDPSQFPTPLHLTIIKRFPQVAVEPMKTWAEMVKDGDIFPTLCIDEADVEESVAEERLLTAHAAQATPPPAEQEDDLILVEKHIETIEVDDEDSDSYEEQRGQLVIDEQALGTNTNTNALEAKASAGASQTLIKEERIDTSERVNTEQRHNDVSDLGIEALQQVNPLNVQATILFESDEDDSDGAPAPNGQNTHINNKRTLDNSDTNIDSVDVKIKKLKVNSEIPSFSSRIRFQDEPCCTESDVPSESSASETAYDSEREACNKIDEKLLMDTVVHLVRLDDTKSWQNYQNKKSINIQYIDFAELEPISVTLAEEESTRKRKAEDKEETRRERRERSESSSDDGDCEIKDEVMTKFLNKKPRENFYKSKRTIRRATRWMSFTESEEKLYGGEGVGEAAEGGGKRVAKRVELPDIEEVRRINSNILTAQVAPLSPGKHEQNASDAERPATPPPKPNPGININGAGGAAEELPSRRALFYLLQDLAKRERNRQQEGRGPARGLYCCPARRDRAINDAKRRMAERAGRSFVPLPIHKHKGKCSCCCLHLLNTERGARLATDLTRLSATVRNLLRDTNPHYQDVLDLMSETPTGTTKRKIETSRSKDKSARKCSQTKAGSNKAPSKAQSASKDCGYEEWLQQKNLCAKYFQLCGSPTEKTNNHSTDNQKAVSQPATPMSTPASVSAPTPTVIPNHYPLLSGLLGSSLAQLPTSVVNPKPTVILTPTVIPTLVKKKKPAKTPIVMPTPSEMRPLTSTSAVMTRPAESLTVTSTSAVMTRPAESLTVTSTLAVMTRPAESLTVTSTLAEMTRPAESLTVTSTLAEMTIPAESLTVTSTLAEMSTVTSTPAEMTTVTSTPAEMTTVTSTPAVTPKSLHNVLDTTQTNKKLNPLNKASLLREDVCNDAVNEMSIGGQSTEPLARDSAPLYADEHLSDLSDETNATPPPAPSPAPPAPSTAPILIEVDVDTKTALYAPPGYAHPPAGLTATCAVETKLKQKAAKPKRGGTEPPPPRHLVIHLPQFVTPKNLDPHPIRALPAPGEDNPCPALKAFFRRRAVTAAEPDDSASADSVGGAVDASEPADPTEAGQRSLPAIEKVLAPSVSISGKSPMHAVLVPRPRVPCATRGPGAARRTPGRARTYTSSTSHVSKPKRNLRSNCTSTRYQNPISFNDLSSYGHLKFVFFRSSISCGVARGGGGAPPCPGVSR